MQGDYNRSRFNVNNAAFELTAGVAYHFGGSNGSHHFTLAKLYDPAEISDLNNSINNLRSQVNEKNGQINVDAQKISALQQEVNNLQNRVVPVETIVETSRIPESIVTFRQGKSTVECLSVAKCGTCSFLHEETRKHNSGD